MFLIPIDFKAVAALGSIPSIDDQSTAKPGTFGKMIGALKLASELADPVVEPVVDELADPDGVPEPDPLNPTAAAALAAKPASPTFQPLNQFQFQLRPLLFK